MKFFKSPRQRRRTRGHVAVEMAMVAPLIFLFVFGAIEFGRALFAIHCLESAAYESCRAAIVEGATEQEVEAVCESWLAGGGITEYDYDLSAESLSAVEQWAPVTVTVKASYGDVSWLPVPDFIGDAVLSASCTLPREAKPESTSEE